MPRGGRRPGAGAPKGNLNALKTGARSRQLRAVLAALLIEPHTRRVLLQLARRQHLRREEFRQTLIAVAKLLNDHNLATSIKEKIEEQLRDQALIEEKTQTTGQSKPGSHADTDPPGPLQRRQPLPQRLHQPRDRHPHLLHRVPLPDRDRLVLQRLEVDGHA